MACALLACQSDESTKPAAEPTGNRVALVQADDNAIAPGDSTRIRAWVVNGPDPGDPVADAPVVFGRVAGGSTGVFSKTETLTDTQGWASTLFRPAEGDTGLMTIRASTGTSVNYTVVHVTAGGGTPAPDRMSLALFTDRDQIPADSTSLLTITIRVLRGTQTPVAGEQIILAAGDRFTDSDGDGVHGEGEPITVDRDSDGVWDAEGELPEVVTTNNSGEATFNYRAGGSVGPVYLRATASETSVEMLIQQHPLSVQLRLYPDARDLLADGVSTMAVRLTATDWAGDPQGGILARFVCGEPFRDADSDGYFSEGVDTFTDLNENGVWDAIGSITSTATTGSDGSATVYYRAGVTPATVSIRATAPSWGSGVYAEASVNLLTLSPAWVLEPSLETDTAYADGQTIVGGSVLVRDINGEPLAGKRVALSAGERFTDTNGDGRYTPGVDQGLVDLDENGLWTEIGSITPTALTNEEGRADFEYTAGWREGEVWIYASADGRSGGAPLTLTALPATYQMDIEVAFDRITVEDGGGIDNTSVTVTCRDVHGLPTPAGVPVEFAIINGPGGGERLEGAIDGVVNARTNEQGRAFAVLKAGTVTGLVQVGARSGSTQTSAGVYILSGLAASVSCHADSISLIENHSCVVHAYVYDQAHNAIRDGTIVLFHTDEGMIFGADGEGVSQTVNGEAQATFVAFSDNSGGDGLAEVVAETNGGINGRVFCTTYIRLPGKPGEISRLELSSLAPELAVRGTGGLERGVIRARGYDAYNLPVGSDRRVVFRIEQGPGGGEYFEECACDSAVSSTDAAGYAEAVLWSGTRSGTVVLSARAAENEHTSVNTAVGIAAGPPVYISVGAENCNLRVCDRVNVPNPVVALVYDTYRNPVRDGTAVHFTTDIGMIAGDQGLGISLTTEGRAAGTWWSDGDCGLVRIAAATGGGELVDEGVAFIASGPPHSATFLQPSEDLIHLSADQRSEADLRIEVLDHNGLYTTSGAVEVTALYGTTSTPTASQDGCYASISRASYFSPTLDRDHSYTIPDDGIGAIDEVRATAGFGPQGDLLQVALHTGPASISHSDMTLDTTPPGAQTYFNVEIKDAWGNPLGGHRLSLWASDGIIDEEAITDAGGLASSLSFTAPDTEMTVSVEIRDLDPQYSGGLIIRRAISIRNPN